MKEKVSVAPFWAIAGAISVLAMPLEACASPEGKTVSEKEAIAGLPYARGRSFRTLGEYLLYLEQYNGTIGLPWWRAIGPDRFEFVTSMRSSSQKREVATRTDLEKRFGFVK